MTVRIEIKPPASPLALREIVPECRERKPPVSYAILLYVCTPAAEQGVCALHASAVR